MYEPVENPSNNIIILTKKRAKIRVKLFNKYLKVNRLNYKYYIPIVAILLFFIIFCLVKLKEKNNETNDLQTFIKNNIPKNILDNKEEKEKKDSQINNYDIIPLKFHPEKIKNDNDPNEMVDAIN